ncbi:adenosylcobalamin-dependent ribonucleoside-diphosphate reductase [Bacillus xiapuensis]|uniref:Vitamin B12-dependent ribonucleotide reductase n=1 Tax=Bacillus xiapuensis TaxID=2014075 RepID=A0ABU6N874_9BACI|nr:adenosylcobalamin-dependent ribonucleoside-diphosphate reductase [Bacillus xiapuensis]
MSKLHQFEHKDMLFSKDGQLDELIALDRYTIPSYDGYEIGDTVVAIVDKQMGTKKVGTIEQKINDNEFVIKDRFDEKHTVTKELLQKPLETEPHQLWNRWAKGAASVEKTEKLKRKWENEFRWLFDGYRYSLGGRIQLMLGQEFHTGKRADLTAYNCFVVRSPRYKEEAVEQFLDVVDVAFYEASIMRRGGGVGLNISHIKTVEGSKSSKSSFKFLLEEGHKDSQELQDRIQLGKFDDVEVYTDRVEWENAVNVDNSYVFAAGDSVDELFDGLKDTVKYSYDRNIVGIDFTGLRHRNAIVKGVNGRSSGSVSWMELFVLIARLLQQDTIDNVEFAEIFSDIVHLIIQGGSRRGALMLICEDDNPNVYKFMERKKQMGYLSGANISVGISDTFMQRVKRAKENLKVMIMPNEEDQKALNLWNVLIESAWSSAEPGIVWMERYNKESNSWYFHEIVATNPCGEQGLPEFGVCNLGHFVLSRFYDQENNDVLWNELERAVRVAVRLQDNIIDYTQYFLDENKQVQLSERRVGIGSLGLGTLMIQLGLRYGSDKGNEFVDKLYKFIAKTAYEASMDYAEEKGTFPEFDYDKFIQSGFMKKLLAEFPQLQEKLKSQGIRNVTLLTQAPTGSTGTYIDNIPEFRKKFGGTTTGIEPYFSWEYYRAGRLGINKQTVDLAKEYMEQHGITEVKDLPEHFVTAMDLQPSDHVKVQAAVQKWTDSSISKTANCPRDYTIEQTDELYMLSYDLGLKGMTIYRDGSREAQVLATNEEDAKLESHIEAEKLKKLKEETVLSPDVKNVESQIDNVKPLIQKRPKRLYGFTDKVGFSYGDKFGRAYVTINLKDGEPWEVFISTKEKDVSSLAKALGLMTTKLLRLGGASDNLQQAIDTLTYDQTMGTLPYSIANILKQIQKEKFELEVKTATTEGKKFELAECPNCGEKAYDKGNCICHACGVSKCN